MKNSAALVALAFASIAGVLYMDSLQPRGIKNRNPLNIRHNPRNNWRGMIGTDDKQFVVFESPEYGFRAATRTLQSYAKRGIVSVRQIITTWSPPVGIDADGNEYTNPTESYIKGVSNKIGIEENAVVLPSDYPALLAAMTHHENGKMPYSMETIIKGVELA